MNTIYVYRPTTETRDCAGVAYDETGEQIAFHVSSSLGWFRHDMGLEGNWHHDEYQKRYPDGFTLVEVVGRNTNEDFERIFRSPEEVI